MFISIAVDVLTNIISNDYDSGHARSAKYLLCKTLFLALYWLGRNNTKTIFYTPRTQRKILFFERRKEGKIISLKRKSFKFILKHFKCHFFSIKISTLLDTVEYQTAAYFDILAFEKIWKDWYIWFENLSILNI